MAAPVFRRLSSHLSRALPRPFSSIDNAPSLFPSFPQAGSVAVPTLPIHACGSMELMAVPKKKVSRHKKGLRNGPKALKPVPVIVRCKAANLFGAGVVVELGCHISTVAVGIERAAAPPVEATSLAACYNTVRRILIGRVKMLS